MHGMSTHVYLLMVIIFPLILSFTFGVAVPHLIHATILLANPWAQEDWQLERVCRAIVEEHSTCDFDHETWFITEVKAERTPSTPIIRHRVARVRVQAPTIIRRHLTQEDVYLNLSAQLLAIQPDIVADYRRSLLMPAIEHALKCTALGWPTGAIKKLERLVMTLPDVPYEVTEAVFSAHNAAIKRNHEAVLRHLGIARNYYPVA
jgi:hypothetical protein